MRLSGNLNRAEIMNKIRNFYYAICFYIWSTNSFADTLSCSELLNLQSFAKYGSIVILFLGIGFIGLTGDISLIIPILLMCILANFGLSFMNGFGGVSTQNCSEVTSPDIVPETHYWQSFLNIAFYFGCLVLPLLVMLIIFGVISWCINKSQISQITQDQTAFVKRKSGELLFYLNQLYKQHKGNQNAVNGSERLMKLIYEVHEGKEQLTVNKLQHYIKEYRDIRLDLFINTCLK